MPVTVTCSCGAVYHLKDEYAGEALSCPRCDAPVRVPRLPPPPPVKAQEGDPVFARDKFLLNERHFGVSEKYSVADPDGRPLLFVERPNYPFLNVLAYLGGVALGTANFLGSSVVYYLVRRGGQPLTTQVLAAAWCYLGSTLLAVLGIMTFPRRRHVTVYRDDSRRETLLRITQDRRLQLFSASYTLSDQDGKVLARLMKKRLRNIFRKRWYCLAPDGSVMFIAREDSMILSVLRRLTLGFFGFFHTDFVLYGPGWRVLGEFNRRATLLDRYVLDLAPDALRSADRRAALALGVMLDTGEGR